MDGAVRCVRRVGIRGHEVRRNRGRVGLGAARSKRPRDAGAVGELTARPWRSNRTDLRCCRDGGAQADVSRRERPKATRNQSGWTRREGPAGRVRVQLRKVASMTVGRGPSSRTRRADMPDVSDTAVRPRVNASRTRGYADTARRGREGVRTPRNADWPCRSAQRLMTGSPSNNAAYARRK